MTGILGCPQPVVERLEKDIDAGLIS